MPLLLLWAESPAHSMHDLHAACLNDLRKALPVVCNSKMLHPPSFWAGRLLLGDPDWNGLSASVRPSDPLMA